MVAAVEECAALVNVRVDDMRARKTPLTSREIMTGLWDWAESYPAHARLLYVWSVSGPPAVQTARQKFVDWYVKRTLGYFPEAPKDPVEAAFQDLASRTYMTFSMYCCETWHAGWGVFGEKDKERILNEMAHMRMSFLATSL